MKRYRSRLIIFSFVIMVGVYTVPFTDGSVVFSSDDHIKGALVDVVELYPQKHAGTDDKIALEGLLVRYKDAVGTVLICHGFMGNQRDSTILRRLFPKGKFNCMTFDFRAHGPKSKCSGQYCTFGRDESCDVSAAAKFLKEHPSTKNLPLFVYGFSMGAVAAIQAQSKEPLFNAMVLDCPFDSSVNTIKRSLDNVKFSLFGYEFNMPGRDLLGNYAFHPYIQSLVKKVLRAVAGLDPRNIDIHLCPVEPKESIRTVDIPCFFIHCKNDDRISVDAIRSVFNAAQGYKTLWLTNGRWHFDSYFYNPEKYTERVRQFLDDVLLESLPDHKNNKIITDGANIFEAQKFTGKT